MVLHQKLGGNWGGGEELTLF